VVEKLAQTKENLCSHLSGMIIILEDFDIGIGEENNAVIIAEL